MIHTTPPPPEWAPHHAVWTAWPSDAELWGEDLAGAQDEVAGMIEALIAPGPNGRVGDQVRLLVDTEVAARSAQERLGDQVAYVRLAYGDVWLRDTGPVFLSKSIAVGFHFNGWGGKYQLPGDADLADRVAVAADATLARSGFVLEGGAVEMDGEGTLITTRECLLNLNRNPGWTQAIAEQTLGDALGAKRVIWLDRGLLNDHTDGHVDNLARFVAPGRVVVQRAAQGDPNADVLAEIEAVLRGATDAAGRRLQVDTLISPGRSDGEDGAPAPASHMNFFIGNSAVVVPSYGALGAGAAAALQAVFPDRRVVARPARRLLSGGGAFHCITQQQPV